MADFGCGDAELARMAPQEKVHSLDLVSSAPGVIACNMADTPLGRALSFEIVMIFIVPCVRMSMWAGKHGASGNVAQPDPCQQRSRRHCMQYS